jgi:uncharacterized protein YyaL (SSP411 family)
MTYDNAQLARVYLHAYQVTGNEFYKRITMEFLDYVVREMTSPEGGFDSSQEADSEGHEGKFFVWTPEEIRSALGGSSSGVLIGSKSKRDVSDAALVMDAYGMTTNGNPETIIQTDLIQRSERRAQVEQGSNVWIRIGRLSFRGCIS